MTEAGLGTKSIPRNPLLFGILHRMEAVERIGSGIRRIRDLCREHGVAEPVIDVSNHWVTTTFPRPAERVRDQVGTKPESRPESRPESQPESQPESLEQRVLSLLRQASMAKSAISTGLGQNTVSGQLNKMIRSLVDGKLIEYTIPEKPNSRLQKYRLTENGKSRLANLEGGSS